MIDSWFGIAPLARESKVCSLQSSCRGYIKLQTSVEVTKASFNFCAFKLPEILKLYGGPCAVCHLPKKDSLQPVYKANRSTMDLVSSFKTSSVG